ncbi:hypothetical protein MY04_0344 [Flammeovirga sp. MY04]|uniref:hypothetical protein n=1 Tax=Flammeovirga sp. MY04 TaxID=1191459 RepID=UPI0008064403|nr:hypothetical protein [Flammeovirga sp. MY04]ANQ47726.1 hypothetical protein MY04_0344 [Flammeovirga sp. MY04]
MTNLFFCCTTKNEEKPNVKELDLPRISLVDSVDFLRRTAKLTVNITDYEKELLTIQQVGLYSNGSLIADGILTENNKYNFEFDSKLLPEGMNDLEVIAQFEEAEGLLETKTKLNITIEVDNYFPSVVVEDFYVSSRSSSFGPRGYIYYSDHYYSFFFTDENGKRISEIYDVSKYEGDSINLEIPEEFEGQSFMLCKINTYTLNYSEQTIYNKNTKYKKVNLSELNSNDAPIEYKLTSDITVEKEITIIYPKEFNTYSIGYNFKDVDTKFEGNNVVLSLKVTHHLGEKDNDFYGNYFICKKINGEYIYLVTSLIESGTTIILSEDNFSNVYDTQIFKNEDKVFDNNYVMQTLFQVFDYNEAYCIINDGINKMDDGENTIYEVMRPMNSVNKEYKLISTVYGNGYEKRISNTSPTLPILNYNNFISDDNFIHSYDGQKVILKSSYDEGNLNFRITRNIDDEEGEYLVKTYLDIDFDSEVDFDFSKLDLGLEEFHDPRIRNILELSNSDFTLLTYKDVNFLTDGFFYNKWFYEKSGSRKNYVELPQKTNDPYIVDNALYLQ